MPSNVLAFFPATPKTILPLRCEARRCRVGDTSGVGYKKQLFEQASIIKFAINVSHSSLAHSPVMLLVGTG